MPPSNRSVRVNGEALRQFRLSRGWTQNDLSRTAGYSLRLIGKAESGAAIDIETVRVLAQALSTDDMQITEQRLTVDNLFVAKAWMAALNRDGKDMVTAIEEYLSEDFVFHCPGDPAIAPFAGTWYGAAGLRTFFGIYFSIFQRIPSEDITYSAGQDLVVARFMEYAYMGPQLCGPLRVNMCFQFSDGHICRIDDDYDTLGGVVIKVRSDRIVETQTNMARVLVKCYDLGGKELATACEGFFTDDFVFNCPANADQFPFGGEWKGMEGAQRFLDIFYGFYSRRLDSLTPEFLPFPERIAVRFVDQFYYQENELPAHWINIQIHFCDDRISQIEFEFNQDSAKRDLDELSSKLGHG
jgi:transcriptional regulator with XRE-family HTH domain